MERRFQVVLIEPEIPFNTGAIARLCVATGSTLHLVGRLGFQLDDRHVRRAGLDYWSKVNLVRHDTFEAYQQSCNAPCFFFSAHAETDYTCMRFPDGAALVFGSETRGLPPSLKSQGPLLRIPILPGSVRSLNLAMSAGIVLYEAIRQNSPIACEARR